MARKLDPLGEVEYLKIDAQGLDFGVFASLGRLLGWPFSRRHRSYSQYDG